MMMVKDVALAMNFGEDPKRDGRGEGGAAGWRRGILRRAWARFRRCGRRCWMRRSTWLGEAGRLPAAKRSAAQLLQAEAAAVAGGTVDCFSLTE